MHAVFVHGSGRSGAAAWPGIDRDDFVFVTRYGFVAEPARTDFDTDVAIVLEAVGEGAHVVAHSYGGIAALLAAAASDRVRSLVLVEPAAFSLSRGLPATEAHVGAMAPALAQWERLDAAAFAVAFMTALGVPDVSPPESPEGLLTAERWRLQRPPWDAQLDPTVPARIPTLVVTGNWNAEYEEVAARLVELGARHELLEGFGHAAHEHPEFMNRLQTFWADGGFSSDEL